MICWLFDKGADMADIIDDKTTKNNIENLDPNSKIDPRLIFKLKSEREIILEEELKLSDEIKEILNDTIKVLCAKSPLWEKKVQERLKRGGGTDDEKRKYQKHIRDEEAKAEEEERLRELKAKEEEYQKLNRTGTEILDVTRLEIPNDDL